MTFERVSRTLCLLGLSLGVWGCGAITAKPRAAQPVRSEQLAIATSAGLFVWDRPRGLQRIATLHATAEFSPVRFLSWSSDGEYLGWMQQSSIAGPGTLHWVEPGTRRSRTWQVADKERLPSALLVTAEGIATFEPSLNGSPSQLRLYRLSGASSTIPTVIAGYEALPYQRGFISMVPSFESTTYTYYRVGLSGSASSITGPPGAATSDGQSLTNWAISPSGDTLAAERGDHTDGCGNGPASKLELVSLRTGANSVYPLPKGPRWRVVTLVYSPDGLLEVIAADTSSACSFSNGFPDRARALMPTTLFELRSGGLVPVTSDVLAADRSPTGRLATISGDWRLTMEHGGDYSDAAPTGVQDVRMGSAVIGVPGLPSIASWAPAPIR
jgi:hypothetical protein